MNADASGLSVAKARMGVPMRQESVEEANAENID